MQEEIHPDDLITCESEALHTIGHIQSHSYLVALDVIKLKITHVSHNFSDLLKTDVNLLGKSIDYLDENLKTTENTSELANLLKISLKERNLATNFPYKLIINEIEYNVILNSLDFTVIIELEKTQSTKEVFDSENLLGEVLMELNFSEKDFEKSLQIVADKVKKIIHYDRVMIYKFWEDAHGEVIAESKNEDLKPLNGIHFPASDIPQQARDLYVKNITRILVDVEAKPVPILSQFDTLLDLTHTQSRAISPMHIEYLRNMGVKASYSISLIVNNKLWGLIACHNYKKEGFINYANRNASKIISQYLSNLLFANQSKLQNIVKEERFNAIDILDNEMKTEWDIIKGLSKNPKLALAVCEAEGFAISHHNKYESFGKCPPKESVFEIINYIKTKTTPNDLFATNNLSTDLKSAKNYSETASGIMSIALNRDEGDYIICFKPEFISKVTWGGKDEKEYSKDEKGKFRLSPRKSFEKWQQSIYKTSIPWTELDEQSVLWLKNKVLSIIQHKANEVARLNIELTHAYEELDSFSYTLSHDLKTPLSVIQGYLEILEDESEDENPILGKMARNAVIMQEMVSNVLEYSKLGRSPINLIDVNVYDLMSEIKTQMLDSRHFSAITLEVPTSTKVSGNKMMVYQVFLNLIENAIKYKDSKKDSFVKVTVEEYSDVMHLFKIEDNGIGIESKHYDKVFGLFKQVNQSSGIEGSGVGLAIVKKIINKHGGRIWVESTFGVGSIFYILLRK